MCEDLNAQRGKTMKGLVCLVLLVLVVALLGSCAPAALTPADTGKAIEPGDRIGNVTVTKGEGEDILYLWNGQCIGQSDVEDSCKADVGAKANVSVGVYDETHTGKLDSLWAEHTYEMSLEGRPVNLQAFGSIDVPHPLVLTLRAWNVVLIADTPGQVTVHSKGVVHGEPFTQTVTYTFSAP
jgi:hypothetical protein